MPGGGRKRKAEPPGNTMTLDRFLKKRKVTPAQPKLRVNQKPGVLLQDLRRVRHGQRYSSGLWERLATANDRLGDMAVDLVRDDVCDACTIAFDREHRLALTGGQAEGKKGVLRVLDANPSLDTCWEDVFASQLEHTISSCAWNNVNDAQCFVSFAHKKEVWCVDLEECEEEAMKPVYELKGSDHAIMTIVQYGATTTLVGAGNDGRVHVWDTRTRGETAVVQHSGTCEMKGKVGQFGGLGPQRRRGAAATYDGSKLEVKVPFPATALAAGGGHTLWAGYADGRVISLDMRCLARGAVHASTVHATLRGTDGNRIQWPKAPKLERHVRVVDMLSSPFSHAGVVCLLQSGVVVELDVEREDTATRVYAPYSPSIADDDDDGDAGDGAAVDGKLAPHARMCYVPNLSALAVPAPAGVAVIPWSPDRFGKWTMERAGSTDADAASRKTFSTHAPSYNVVHPVVHMPFKAYGVAYAEHTSDLLCGSPSGLYRSRYL